MLRGGQMLQKQDETIKEEIEEEDEEENVEEKDWIQQLEYIIYIYLMLDNKVTWKRLNMETTQHGKKIIFEEFPFFFF